ncbi:MAG: cytochrome P450 [Solirubrobacterales bacterium]
MAARPACPYAQVGRELHRRSGRRACRLGRARDAAAQPSRLRRPPPLTEPLRAGGQELPAGVSVLVPSALLNRDPRGYEAPDEFRPERWRAGSDPAVPFFPFGGGIRRCVGENLARAEIESVVPVVLSVARPEPLAAEPEPMVQRATVLVPRRSLLVRAAQEGLVEAS